MEKNAEKETLRKAAEAAVTMIQKLGSQKTKIEVRIQSLSTVINAYETLTGKRLPKEEISKEWTRYDKFLHAWKVNIQNTDTKRRIPRGQIERDVDAILIHGARLTEPAIRSRIRAQFNIPYGRTSILSVLNRNTKKGKYLKENGRWSLANVDSNFVLTENDTEETVIFEKIGKDPETF